VETPFGVPPGTATNDAPVTVADGEAIACAIAKAADGVIVAWADPATVSTTSASAAAIIPRDRADLIMVHFLPALMAAS